MPVLEQRERDIQIKPIFSKLQSKVVQRADRGEYSILWMAALIGLVVGFGFVALSHFSK